MIDSEAIIDFVHEKWLDRLKKDALIKPKLLRQSIHAIDGCVIVSKEKALVCCISLLFAGFPESWIWLVIASLTTYDVVLGLSWLDSINPDINWATQIVMSWDPSLYGQFSQSKEPETSDKNKESLVSKDKESLRLRLQNSLLNSHSTTLEPSLNSEIELTLDPNYDSTEEKQPDLDFLDYVDIVDSEYLSTYLHWLLHEKVTLAASFTSNSDIKIPEVYKKFADVFEWEEGNCTVITLFWTRSCH